MSACESRTSPRWREKVGTKRIPYGSIEGVRRIPMTALGGKARIWGSTTLHYWAHLDPGRPRKQVGLVLDVGPAILPCITPSDPDAVQAIIAAEAGITVQEGGPTGI